MNPASGLFSGTVVHRRLRPKRHQLRYRVFWLLLDLDELDALDGRLRLFSRGRFNMLSFYDGDHGASDTMTLRQLVTGQLHAAGITQPIAAIRLLTMPRMFGYAFNPISLFFCHAPDGQLAAIVYEVHNTFGQRHSYIAAIDGPADSDNLFRHACQKQFYVSPFLGMDLDYDFAVRPPADAVSLAVNGSDEAGIVIATSMTGERHAITDRSLLGAVFSHPLLTLKVIAGIHWEALKLWRKGVPLTRRPPPPSIAVTLITERQREEVHVGA
ncbi:hypothetical protein SAMN02745157_5008 [Kaistia soli DSM 19436]|uniref:DUF1365 domain-containing protein n=1 Tax=Kaistia soli DSM 19436 TaxID=1122133 RepID=A0A1M5NI85_9HYPH|nr:DUF1365 family protein [Kaistia soli]SHG89177.1 hypothetical protein SAMN02745157_5008 [Kaistia soli DSM 19436]